MKLVELRAQFIKITSVREFSHVQTLPEAQGIIFLCPKCFEVQGGQIGTHSVICWFANCGVPDDLDPKPGRWNPAGTGYDDLTFVPPGPVSVLLLGGCGWHGFVKDGDAT